jgi:hypothetical protein
LQAQLVVGKVVAVKAGCVLGVRLKFAAVCRAQGEGKQRQENSNSDQIRVCAFQADNLEHPTQLWPAVRARLTSGTSNTEGSYNERHASPLYTTRVRTSLSSLFLCTLNFHSHQHNVQFPPYTIQITAIQKPQLRSWLQSQQKYVQLQPKSTTTTLQANCSKHCQ